MPSHVHETVMQNPSVVEQLQSHATGWRKEQTAFTYINRDGTETDFSFGELNHRVQTLAFFLGERVPPGGVVCLPYPHGMDFVTAFLACLHAGVIAVPCSPPKRQHHRSFQRLHTIFANACPDLLLTHSTLKTTDQIDSAGDRFDVISTDDLVLDATYTSRRPAPNDVAFIQYTSGSTGTPKGVIVTHANIAANELAIQHAFRHTPESVTVSWLPMYHDMGLIGGLLQSLYVGFRSVLLSPQSFLSNPVRWLEAIGRHRATTTGAPNFAYDLCCSQINDKQLPELDLSCLEIAYNGSEPVRAATLARFTSKFSQCGFRPEAFFPCYGMSEATLLISGGPPGRVTPKLRVTSHSLDQAATEPLVSEQDFSPVQDHRTLVSCGRVTRGTTVAIVDRDSHQKLPTGEVGEIWVNGASVAAGYWNDEQATRETFRARISGDACDCEFLRTGDLGFLDSKGELFISGRMKDVIVVGGRNIYPQDVEAIAELTLELSPQVRTVAVPSDHGNRERVTLAVECNGELRKLARAASTGDTEGVEACAAKLRQAIAVEFDVGVDRVAFMKTGKLPKTTSGKVRRRALRNQLNNGCGDVLYLARLRNTTEPDTDLDPSEYVRRILNESVTHGKTPEGKNLTLDQLGLDSLGKQSVIAAVERKHNMRFDEAEVTAGSTIQEIAGLIRRRGTRVAAPSPHFQASGVADDDACRLARVDSKVTSLTDFAQRESRDLIAKTRDFRAWLEDAQERGFKRYLLPIIQHRGGRALVGSDGYSAEREVILFASADYLGLAHDPRVKQAAANAILENGCNVASVPLVAGSTLLHKVLEQQLSELLGYESCVLFPTGHSANIATIAALCSQQDTVVVDNRVHYSILEGVRLAHSPWRTFRHNNPDSLRTVLRTVRKTNHTRGVLVVLEGVYGIEGDLADLDSLITVARDFDACVMVDDAHSIGVLGARGEGTVSHQQSQRRADILMGSLSKSLGSFGGFIAASRDVVDYLRFYAKAISFAVGVPIVSCAAGLEALRIIRNEPDRLANLRAKAQFFRDALVAEGFAEAAVSRSTIMSANVGSEGLLREIVKELFEQGIWAEGLPFPAVSRGQERARFRVRYEHETHDLAEAARITGETCRRLMPRRLSVPGTDITFGTTIVRQLTRQQASEICDLAIDQARRLSTSLPWVSREFITKYLLRADYWQHMGTSHAWHLSYDNNRIVSAFSVDKTETTINGQPTSTVLLGSFAVAEGHEASFRKQISEAIAKVSRLSDFIAAPASHPVQVFGSGFQDWHATGGKPFLESSLPTALSDALVESGLKPAGAKRYYRVAIESHEASPSPDDLVIRDFRRSAYEQEIDFVSPIIDQTLGQLDLCTTISPAILKGLIRDLRELVLPGFWLMAELDRRPAAFAFCYPNITVEFRRIAGDAGIADFQLIHEAMETAEEAFVAWLGVSPEFAEQGIALALLDELRIRLLGRGYKYLWLSWELIDGQTPIRELAKSVGRIENVADMQVFASIQNVRKPTAVPKPHFDSITQPRVIE